MEQPPQDPRYSAPSPQVPRNTQPMQYSPPGAQGSPYPHYPQYPQYPQYPPQPLQDYPPQPPQYPRYSPQTQVMYYQNQSFTGKAVAAFLLYWLGYIPGLIFNIMFLMEARRVETETGRTPSGYGCLWATLIGSLIPAALFVSFCLLVMISSSLSGAPGH